jgi:hypothetical protein
MYVPHYDAILHGIGTSREAMGANTEITIPVSLFKFLMKIAVSQAEINLPGYLGVNRDVQDAAKKGQVPDPAAHYVNFGFFEGRRGATPAVDEAWYRRNYVDIAAAVRRGDISSGGEHFNMMGAEEFRAPSATYLEDATAWAAACGKGRVGVP